MTKVPTSFPDTVSYRTLHIVTHVHVLGTHRQGGHNLGVLRDHEDVDWCVEYWWVVILVQHCTEVRKDREGGREGGREGSEGGQGGVCRILHYSILSSHIRRKALVGLYMIMLPIYIGSK